MITKFDDFLNESVAVQRVILPEMVEVSNNSRLTSDVSLSIANKLEGKELDDFRKWLKLITPTSKVLQLKTVKNDNKIRRVS